MFDLNEFYGKNSLASAWTDALYDEKFEFFVQRAEDFTSKQSTQKYLSRMLSFLQSISISDVALRAERDAKHLERVCRGYYKFKVYPSDYHQTAYRRLEYANFPYEDQELCIAIGVAYLSSHFRIWACKRYLREVINQYGYMSTQENWHEVMNEMQNWINHHYGDPTFAKIYLRAFDLKVLNYYTRRFDGKSVYEYLREYMKDRDKYRLKNIKNRYYMDEETADFSYL